MLGLPLPRDRSMPLPSPIRRPPASDGDGWIGGFELPAYRPAVGWLVVALLLALAVFGALAGIGALRLLQQDPIQRLSLEPPSDVQALVLSSRDRLPALPPLAMTRLDDGSAKSRIYVDRSGAVRIEQYASADATEPDTYMILSGNSCRIAGDRGVREGLGRQSRGHRR